MWVFSLSTATISGVLIALGIVFLLNNLDIIDVTPGRVWSVIWPVLLIIIGLSMVRGMRLYRRYRGDWRGPRGPRGE